MSYASVNGAVGKSPLIDKINQLPKEEISGRVSEQMEHQVFCSDTGDAGEAGGPVPFSFGFCRDEVKRQLERRR